MSAASVSPETFDTALVKFLETPSAWGALILLALFLYFWRKDVSNPQRSASSAVLSGAVESAVSVYAMAKEAVDEGRECRKENLALRKQNEALRDYIRDMHQDFVKAGIEVRPMPEELWQS